jgi:hypothetical protein
MEELAMKSERISIGQKCSVKGYSKPFISLKLERNCGRSKFSYILFICAEGRAIGIYCGTFVQKISRDFYGADGDNVLSQYTRVHNVTWLGVSVNRLWYW